MRRDKRRNKVLLLTILILGISIGFAALATTLKINGTASIGGNTWNVHWANVGDVQKSSTTTIVTGAKVNENDDTKVDFEVTLNQPGDFYEFQVDAENAGTLDAMVSIVSQTTVPSYANLTVKYADGTEIEEYDLLPRADSSTTPVTPSTERIKVRLEFKRDIDPDDLDDIGDDESISIVIDVPYGLADDNAFNRHGSVFEIGEYFRLVPDKATATTTTPGFSGSTPITDQTLWRVININEDGTTEAVADSASTGEITVSGIDGYKYYIAGLQDIASCYAKSGYTVATRMMGYDGQTAVIEDTSAFDGTSTKAPSKSSTPTPSSGTGEEYMNGVLGDTLYLRDYLLVKNTYDGSIEPSPAKAYLLASRYYDYYSANSFGFYGICSGCLDNYYSRYFGSSWGEYSRGYAVRPIITLRSGIKTASGTGVKNDPFILK